MPTEEAGYYETLVARNDLDTPWFKRKIRERVAAVSGLLKTGQERVLEVGCAEGELGREIKTHFAVTYDGVELSQDSALARHKLDQVFQTPASQIEAAPYQLIVSFHVLEHIARPEQELAAWASLLSADGCVLIEVPNQAGHPLLDSDRNAEHLHQFTPASLNLLLARCGFTCDELSVGHYESPVYSDSLRLTARLQPTAEHREQLLLQRFREITGGPFLVYGIGGDYLNYLAPLADSLDIRALLDSSEAKWGQRLGQHVVSSYDPQAHAELPIVICSIRFAMDIRQHLLNLGIAAQRLIGLDSIYEDS
ncbi:class I SAM-dependent methyltransferase [Pseudomonas mosselii]|uniref:class I SAM-dependent methyltransferase n=1 Tax=Pseudomonas mosselii TaxID=78327 RepID=UPI000BB52426|nr:class I SAM-dependent methyltransferase [Pseudomonas mosselii]ATB66873.1 methyltransferase type 12 [Pseudomonas mosselii]MDH1102300.1 class I SAM-dependent methyltransferase [Pseudomonas mosselii]MEB5933431.1 class I SAM-dependent methyltransferase [Pseudomonas mosselii]UVN43021.1 class I SAM-dependent methyltransferase [Pseudomonas mosselii]